MIRAKQKEKRTHKKAGNDGGGGDGGDNSGGEGETTMAQQCRKLWNNALPVVTQG